jgi:hypothetical protein
MASRAPLIAWDSSKHVTPLQTVSCGFALIGAAPSVAVLCAVQARVVVLGGAFYCNGNVNPAAEANVFGDPEAANVVFSRQAGRRAGALGIATSPQKGGRMPPQWKRKPQAEHSCRR